jgi:signal transduction histidine kinase
MKSRILLQVAAPALLTGLVLIGVSIGSAWSIHRLQANLTSILSESVASVQASSDLENRIRQLRYHSFLYMVRPDDELLAEIALDERNFQDAFARAEAAASTSEETAYLKKIASGFDHYQKEVARLRAVVARHGPFKDLSQLKQVHPIRHVVEPCQELGQLNREQLERTARESEQLGGRTRAVLLLLGLAGPVGGLIAGYGITRGLTQSITKLRVRVRDVMDRLSASDTRDGIQLTLTADGDLAAMDRQLQQVVVRVEEVMERLQGQQREILRSEQLAAVGQLAAGVAHEVRNPLTGMKLLVEAARRPDRPQPLCGEDLEVIHGEITRLEGIVQHFLDFARPQPLCRQHRDLRDAIARPVELVRARARQQGVDLDVHLPDVAVPVHLDAGQFSTVVVNLLLNALDAMPRGGHLEVIIALGKQTALLTVRDSGPGIAAEVLPRLFTPFASTKPTGTGLGLSLARRIVELHGGQIEGANVPTGGACFRVTLPLVIRDE